MNKSLPHLIGGERVASSPAVESRNPSDLSDVVAVAPADGEDMLDRAVACAAAAQPAWSDASPEFRSDCLDRVGRLLEQQCEELGRLLSREEGKTFAEGRGEVLRASRIFRYFAGEAIRLHGRAIPSVRPGIEIETKQEPLGVVGLITPWNFPIAIPAWKTAPALAFGNAVVLKPAGITPAIAYAMADAIRQAGIPDGVFNLVFLKGAAAGRMASHPLVGGLSFTGSTGVGAQLALDAARSGKRVQLEMGGKNPLIIADDADLERAVAIALDGSFFSSGQRCTASSRLIVTDGIHDRFVAELAKRVGQLKVGHALDPETQIGPVSSMEQRDTIESYIQIAAKEGARVVVGGERVNCATEGYFLAPALVTESTGNMRINREEIFGPVASVIRVEDLKAAIAEANRSEFGLSAGIVTQSIATAAAFKRRVQAGMVMINAPTAGVDYHVPFGGAKASSIGPREQGFAAAEFYTRTKTVYTCP